MSDPNAWRKAHVALSVLPDVLALEAKLTRGYRRAKVSIEVEPIVFHILAEEISGGSRLSSEDPHPESVRVRSAAAMRIGNATVTYGSSPADRERYAAWLAESGKEPIL